MTPTNNHVFGSVRNDDVVISGDVRSARWHYSGTRPSAFLRYGRPSTIVIPTQYFGGTQAMSVSVETRPLVVQQVTPWPLARRRPPEWCDLRSARLRIATARLGANVADLDIVRDARSLADLHHCPFCRPLPAG